jgi:hypothetical protein
MYTLSVMTEMAPNAYLPHVQTVMELLNNTLNTFSELANPVSCYILDTMLHLVPLIEGNQIASIKFANYFLFCINTYIIIV